MKQEPSCLIQCLSRLMMRWRHLSWGVLFVAKIFSGQVFAGEKSLALLGEWQVSVVQTNSNKTLAAVNGCKVMLTGIPVIQARGKSAEKREPGMDLQRWWASMSGETNWPWMAASLRIAPLPRSSLSPGVWLEREVEIPSDWMNQQISLFLERCLCRTEVWLGGEKIGENEPFELPLRLDVTEAVSGGKCRIQIKLHLPLETSGKTNGFPAPELIQNAIVGRMELRAVPKVWIDRVQVSADLTNHSFRVMAWIGNRVAGSGEGNTALQVAKLGPGKSRASETRRFDAPITGQESQVEMQYALNHDWHEWNTGNPVLYRMRLVFNGTIVDRGADDDKEWITGARTVLATPQGVLFNGRLLEWEGSRSLSIPMPVTPPMRIDDWRQIWRHQKSQGRTLARCAGWCPPEAAFAAADEEGIVLAAEVASGLNEADALRAAQMIVQAFGNHPSLAYAGRQGKPICWEWKSDQ